MADPLPPIPVPPAGASWRDQFDYAVALQRHDDMQRQTAAIEAQVAAAVDATRALREATAVAAASPTDKDRWWQLVELMIRLDESGTVRQVAGMGNLTAWANQALDAANVRFPAPTP